MRCLGVVSVLRGIRSLFTPMRRLIPTVDLLCHYGIKDPKARPAPPEGATGPTRRRDRPHPKARPAPRRRDRPHPKARPAPPEGATGPTRRRDRLHTNGQLRTATGAAWTRA